jgi:hypothetical protein
MLCLVDGHLIVVACHTRHIDCSSVARDIYEQVSFCLVTQKAHEELSDGRDIRVKRCNLRIVRAITITILRDFDFRFV